MHLFTKTDASFPTQKYVNTDYICLNIHAMKKGALYGCERNIRPRYNGILLHNYRSIIWRLITYTIK